MQNKNNNNNNNNNNGYYDHVREMIKGGGGELEVEVGLGMNEWMNV